MSSPDPSGKQQTKEAPLAKDRIRVHVNEVIVPVTVTDKSGELVLDLSKSDFHVFDGGAEQTIDRFPADGMQIGADLGSQVLGDEHPDFTGLVESVRVFSGNEPD